MATIVAGLARGGGDLIPIQTPIQAELKLLAGLRSDRDPIVSLYLNTKWSDENQRVRVRLFVQEGIARARAEYAGPDPEVFDRTLEQIDRYVDGLWRQAYDESDAGTAIFACEGMGLWRTFGFRHPMRNQFEVGPTPHLLQLAHFAYDYQPTILAVVDARGAWIFETALGDVVGETRIEHEAHRRHHQGGWSQSHYQRRIEREIARNMAEGADHVIFLMDEIPIRRLILAGTAREVAMFEKLLPTRVRERIIGRLGAPGVPAFRTGEIRASMLDEMVEELLEQERNEEEEQIRRVVAEALAGGLAEIGPEDVVLATNEGRVHRLVIERHLQFDGWRCTNCDALGIKYEKTCGYCGYPTEDVPLAQELVNRVLLEGGEVAVVEPDALLHHYFGVAAVLRHRGARADIGAAAEPLAY